MTQMLDCDHVMRQLWDYLDEELTADRMEAIREHLTICKRCHPHAEFERSFLRALAKARREHSNPARVAHRVRSALVARGYSPA